MAGILLSIIKLEANETLKTKVKGNHVVKLSFK